MISTGTIVTGLAYVTGLCVFYINSRERHFERSASAWLAFAALVGGVIGAKAVRVLFASASGAPLAIAAAHPDGKTIIGGVLGGWVAVELLKMRLKITRSTGDAFALALPIGEAIGRIGCFLNQCCYGQPTNLPWAVYQHDAWRHPAQIYSLISALLIFCLLWFMRKRTEQEGDLFRMYLILWATSRFFLEFVRERTDIHFGLSLAQWVSIEVTVSIGLAMLCVKWFGRRAQKV